MESRVKMKLITLKIPLSSTVRTIISAIVDAILDGDKTRRSEIPGNISWPYFPWIENFLEIFFSSRTAAASNFNKLWTEAALFLVMHSG